MNLNDIKQELIILEEMEAYEAALERELAKQDFWNFCLYMDREFFTTRADILKPIAIAINNLFYDPEKKHLGISIFPRAGKSYITSLASAWWLGKKPTLSVMRVSYGQDLANELSDSVRAIVRDSEKYKEVFPEVEVRKDKQALDNWKLKTSKQQGYCCAGVDGAITGKGASGLCITDDLFKGFVQASSPSERKRAWEFYQGTLDARMEPGVKTIDVGTRWNPEDVLGKLDTIDYFDDYIIVPALDLEGQSTCPSFRTTEEWVSKKEKLDDYIWESEYQQNPIPAEGLMYSRGFKVYDTLPTKGFVKSYCDPANKGSDYLCQIIYKEVELEDKVKEVYILDILYTQEDMKATEKLVANRLIRYEVAEAKFEINKESLFPVRIEERLRELEHRFTIFKTKVNTTNKENRILENSAWVQEYIYFPRGWSSKYPKFYQDVSRHSRSGKNEHDDAAEVLSEIAIEVSGSKRYVIIF